MKSFIWPLVNRVSHVLMMVLFATAYLLGDYDNLLSYHVAFGYALLVVFLFRTIWGFVGPKYSLFRDFNFDFKDLMAYMLNVFTKTKEYAGHNPASSWAIVGMVIVILLTTLTGVLTYGVQENHGILSFLHVAYFKDMDIFKDIHEFFSNLFLALVGAHIAGALIDKFIKKSDAIDSMIDGHKTLSTQVVVRTNIAQKLFAIVWIGATLFSLYYLVFTKDNIFIANANQSQDYALIHPEFSDECGSCHITYPPYLLPKNAWRVMMGDLENHFGDDAWVNPATNASILAFLLANSAEDSTHQSSLKILKSLKGNDTTIAITQTPFWKHKHEDIEKDVFSSKEVKTKANCKACHKDIDRGLIENDLISVPDIKG